MNKIDLHTHSNYSDGTFSPKELVEYAKVKKLKAIAITDHDTIKGLEEGEAVAKEVGIEFINGVELSIGINSKEYHMLGLMFDRNTKDLENMLKTLQEHRIERNKEMVMLFKKNNINIEYQELQDLSQGSIITRAHFSQLLIKKGYAKSTKHCFERYLSPNSKTYIKRNTFNAEHVIETIHKAQGISILAHPYRYKLNTSEIEELVVKLKNIGLDGIEAIYSSHNPNEESFLRNLSYKYNLKISGGSDFHGLNKPDIDLGVGFGKLNVPIDILEKLKL